MRWERGVVRAPEITPATLAEVGNIAPTGTLVTDSSQVCPPMAPEVPGFADTLRQPASANSDETDNGVLQPPHEHVWLPVRTERINNQRGYIETRTYLCACGKAVALDGES